MTDDQRLSLQQRYEIIRNALQFYAEERHFRVSVMGDDVLTEHGVIAQLAMKRCAEPFLEHFDD
jgi:hypothetical protein